MVGIGTLLDAGLGGRLASYQYMHAGLGSLSPSKQPQQ